MGEVLDLAERFWRGEIPRRDLWRPSGKHEELAPGLVFFHTWANVTALRTEAGLVLVDTGNFATRDRTFAAVRAVDSAPLAAAVYTHGHVDHACGLPPFLAEAREKRRPEPAIVAHRNVAARFDRYRMTAPWNGLINSRQFSVAATWPTEYQYPGTVYDTTHALEVGGVRLELTHARGETDDHTWLWWPARRILFTGDLFFWVAPNAGNPQKVQRYAAEWARALRAMADRGAELLIPGHGAPVVGAARVHQALSDTALWLETLVNETVTRMNAGLALEDILAEVKPPAHLSERPYLQAVYDEPDYVIRNIWRLYGGWWDGQPAHLKPAREAEIGLEVAALAGGIDAVVARARALAAEGRLALASHLIDWVAAAAPNSWAVHDARADIYLARAQNSEALMTRGIFSEAARESAIKAGRSVTEAVAGQPSTKPAPPGDPDRRQADSR
ncbi:MAG TPA: alkyl sulfatase dimerization domain-containing protein [Methylomirabilota bacterium]|nr:alkyl sulfatase dimerization domain-containing protein [Methylomirabilota bacterium]